MKLTLSTAFWRSEVFPDRVGVIGRDASKSDWIEKHQQGNGNQLPVLPAFLLPLVNNYTIGDPVSKDIEVIPISGQQWQAFTTNEREMLFELVEFIGKQRAEDYARSFELMFPYTPDFSRKKRKEWQRLT